MVNTKVLGLAVLAAASASAQTPALRFRENGDFKILQIADTQVFDFSTDFCWNIDLDGTLCNAYNTTSFVERLLLAERPDLVVWTGDNVSGPLLDPEGTLEKMFKPVIDSGIPFTAVFGNHDYEGWLDNPALMEWLEKQPNSLATAGPSTINGVGNHLLQVNGSRTNTADFNLWMFDSGTYSQDPNIPGYDWIRENQIQWYKELSEEQERLLGKKNDALAFFHIPTREFIDAANGPIVGSMNEGVACPRFGTPLLDTMLQRGDVRAVAVGHDHNNDFCGKWDNPAETPGAEPINLCYGGSAGYTTYGMYGFDRRARVFVINENDKTIRTYKRLDDDAFSTIDNQQLFPVLAEDAGFWAQKNVRSYDNMCDLPVYKPEQKPTPFCSAYKQQEVVKAAEF